MTGQGFDERTKIEKAAGVLAAVIGIHHVQQLGEVGAVYLVDAPADKLGAPFRVRVARPFAVFGVVVGPFGIAQLPPGDLQQKLHKRRALRVHHLILSDGFPGQGAQGQKQRQRQRRQPPHEPASCRPKDSIPRKSSNSRTARAVVYMRRVRTVPVR